MTISIVQGQDTLKVLFLGNSYTYYNNMPNIVADLAEAGGYVLIHDQNTPGGHTLMEHAMNTTSISKIHSDDWDHIILQDHSLRPAYFPLEHYNGAEQLLRLVNPYGACENKAIFYMTWGRQHDPNYPYATHQQLTTDAYNHTATIFDTEVSPVGVAWKMVRADNDPINLYDPDNTHPSYAGSYLAACVHYATLFDKSPVGSPFVGDLSVDDANYLQQKAWAAYTEYVSNGLIHPGHTTDTLSDVHRAWLTHTTDELNDRITGHLLETSVDYAYQGFTKEATIAANLEYTLWQDNSLKTSTLEPLEMIVPVHQCIYQSATTPLSIDLSDIEAGPFQLNVYLEDTWTASYDLTKPISTAHAEVSEAVSFQLFPNPASDHVQVQSALTIEDFSIYDMEGKQVLFRQNAAQKDSFNVSNLPQGQYIFQAHVNGQLVVRTLTVK